MLQKFKPLTFVRIKETVYYNSPPDQKTDAIVDSTYATRHQAAFESDFKQYMLWIIDNGKVVDRSAMYDEDDLEALIVQDEDKAQAMIEEYVKRDLKK